MAFAESFTHRCYTEPWHIETAVLIHLSMADEVVGIRVKCKKFFIPHVFLPFNGNNNEQELTNSSSQAGLKVG